MAPLATSVTEPPVQIFGLLGIIVITGAGLTLTVTTVVLVQPVVAVPITEYVVVIVGLAITIEPVVALRPVPGEKLYVMAPLAVSVTELPEQIVGDDGLTITVG